MLLTAAIVGLFVLPSPWNVIGLCVAAVVEVGELYLWKRFLDRYRVQGGAEGMLGERAEVIEACDPEGRVKLRGEIWAAVADGENAFLPGDRVRVTAVEGLRVRVGPEPSERNPMLNSRPTGA
jgi:membrane protein implicated in regulation of membrane protease activity